MACGEGRGLAGVASAAWLVGGFRVPAPPQAATRSAIKAWPRVLVMADSGCTMRAPMSQIIRAIDERKPELIALSRKIHAHPELRFEEHQAAAWLTGALEAAGCTVERG